MSILDFLFGKVNHIEKWINTPQEMKERLIIASMQGQFDFKRIGSKRPPKEVNRDIATFINMLRENVGQDGRDDKEDQAKDVELYSHDFLDSRHLHT